MNSTATLTVTNGPEQGQVFTLQEELVHIGHSPDNQVPLADSTLAAHQASIVRRNGRYAIYSPIAQGVEVEGNVIPAARWVWLPSSARLRLGDQTVLEFDDGQQSGGRGSGKEAHAATSAAKTPSAGRKESKRGRKSKRAAARSAKRSRKVARFITDRPGEPMVKLGEDGHLPELHLTEGPRQKQADRVQQRPSSALAYVAVAVSLCLSAVLLLIDLEPSGSSAARKQQARREIAEFYGDADGKLQPYQRLLRQAQLAHSRGDRAAERRAYRDVLKRLNSEDTTHFTGLTGSRQRDERLRELIAILLSR